MPDALPPRLVETLAVPEPRTKVALLAAHAATQDALLMEIARLTELTQRHALAIAWLQRVPDDVLALLVAQMGEQGEALCPRQR